MTTEPTPASQPSPAPCTRCNGEGRIDTGIYEAPTTLCNKCNGTGEQPSPARSDKDAARAKSGTLTPAKCPFCDGSATYLVDRISCDCCLADMSRAKGQSDDDLLAAWSRRAERAPSGESIDTPEFRELMRKFYEGPSANGNADAFAEVVAHIDARRATAGNAAPGALPLKLVDITSHGHAGWANLIYTGDDCPGLPVAMLAPFFVPLFRRIVARNAAPTEECGNCFEGKSDGDHLCRVCNGSGVASNAATAASERSKTPGDLPPLPETLGVADLAYAMETPPDWDEDYRATWQKLQVADANRRQWRAYALSLRELLASNAGAAPAIPEPDAAPKPEPVEITREGRMFWHTNCPKNRFKSGIMRVEKDEPHASLIRCSHCGKAGYYPVGGAGTFFAEEVAPSNPPVGAKEKE